MRFTTKLAMGVAFAALAACGGNQANNVAAENAAELNAGVTEMNAANEMYGMNEMNAATNVETNNMAGNETTNNAM